MFVHSHNTMTMGSEMKCGQIIRSLTKVRLTIPCIGLYAGTICFFGGGTLHSSTPFSHSPKRHENVTYFLLIKCWQWLIVHAILCSVMVEEEGACDAGSTARRRGGLEERF